MSYEDYKALCDKINYHMDLYYNKNTNEISDYEYDQLMLKLKSTEKEHPEWVLFLGRFYGRGVPPKRR